MAEVSAEHPRYHRKAKAGTPEYTEAKLRMVDEAIELLADKGLKKFRFEDLAAKLGCNRVTIYRYFDNKKDLVREVMMRLMYQITNAEIERTAGAEVTRETFTDFLYNVITQLSTDRRYAIVMDDENVAAFSKLTHTSFTAITTGMLDFHLGKNSAGPALKEGVKTTDAVHWLFHQIVSYAYFGLSGETEAEQKAYLEKLVVSAILQTN